MKKILFILCLFAFSVANAQNGWTSTLHEADALKKTKEYTSYRFTDDNDNSFIYWTHRGGFRLVTSDGIFDYDKYNKVKVKVGYYDLDNNLVKEESFSLRVVNNDAQIIESFGAKKLIEYIKTGSGYVRILAPIFRQVSSWEIKVPCKSE